LSVLASLIPEPDATPRFGFAPALSATAWLVLMVYTLEHHWFPQMKTRWVLTGSGGGGGRVFDPSGAGGSGIVIVRYAN